MVLQSLAEMVLSKLLNKVFYGINKQNIQVALLDGKFVLSNIGLQPSLLAELNLPVELKYSYVQRVDIHLPWRKEEVSLTINISNIYMLVATAENALDLYEIFIKRKESIIEQALKEFKSNLEKKQNKKQYGYIEKLFLNLLDNVNIKIECIHFRCENKTRGYSFGIKINEVSAKTVNQDDEPFFFNREKTKEEYIRYIVQMDFMGIYFNSKEDFYLSGRTLAEITDEFSRLSHKRFRNYSQNFDSEQASDNFNYILTISLKTIVKKYINALERLSDNKDEKYLFECVINLNKIESKISDQQYYDLLDVITLISDFQKTYVQFVNRWQLINYKDRKAKDISDLLRKKKTVVVGKREKETLKKNCRKYMGWVFKQTYEDILKRTFIKQAIRKEVNVKNLKKNKKTLAIMNKIDNEKLKLWVLISLYFRKMYEDKVSIFMRGSAQKHAIFVNKYVNSVHLFEQYEFQQEINRHREVSDNKYQVFLKLVANIREFNFQISRENNLGVYFNIQKLRAELILKERNYLIKLSMEDLEADVFHCKKYQKLKTHVPIIKRNCILDRNINLLELTYERNPVGKPFVFTEIDARFQSIQITIYPEAFKQFYLILLGAGDQPQKKKKKIGKKQEVVQNESRAAVRQIGFQKTIIRAKIKTPWIVLPFSPINNPAQECWVARFGDFYVDTPEYDFTQVKTEEQIFYEQYKLQLKRFQLSYFSSINFFYNWLKFNYSLESLYRIKSFANEKIITMIEPFSCFVEFSLLKSSLSQVIRDRKPKIVGKIMIDEIKIKVSKFLMGRFKSKIDNILDKDAQLDEFIQSNISNLRQENQLSGYCKISYDGIKKMNFFCILKGSYMYFFINEQYHKYHFFVNITETALRLISNEVENFNTDRPRLLCFYLGDRQKHQYWRKKILHILNKKARKMNSTTSLNQSKNPNQEEATKNQKNQIAKENEKVEESQNHSNLKLSCAFLMNKLSIQLFDQQDALFLDCNFKKATLQYSYVSQKSLRFSLNEWTVCEGDGNLFIGSNSFFEEEAKQQEANNLNNFLEICCGFNSITQQLKDIQIKVDKLFLAWKVELFTHILLFFFYDEQASDTPTPVNENKRQLQIKISFQKFSFYCYFAEQLLALTKLQFINIRYFQNNIEEIYDVNCKVFEMDKYVNGQREKRVPMIRRKHMPLDNSNESDQLIYNNFNLSYLLRKKETNDYANICRLKKHFGEDVLVSQIFCDWKDTEIYFENQLTLRLLNYILNKVLGTVASKFKKRDYSSNYIFESLKLCKLSAFDIVLNNCVYRMPPHQRGFREFSVEIERLRVTKNIDENFMPTEVAVKTIQDKKQRLFWESMVIKITNARVNYHVGRQPPIQILGAPINISFISSKLNFQREYFVILKHHDDIDRRGIIDIIIEEPVFVQAHKIMFITFLQLFYQNIKHRDGKADIFEPPLPFPSLRQYSIYIQKVGLNMYYFHQKNNSCESFSRFLVDRFKIFYKQIGQQSSIRLEGQTLQSTGELPIYCLDPKRKKFVLNMSSKQGEMKVVINVEHYALEADLDKVNNIIEFINYDSDYVSNKIMVKKPSSWQYVNLFAKNCQLRQGALRVEGEFYISYLKGMKNDPQNAAKEYLLNDQALYGGGRGEIAEINWEDLTDKQIKVNGQDLKLSIHGDRIGGATSFFFNRYELTCKSTNKRYKKERVQVGQGALHIQLVDLLAIWEVYNTYIRKKSNFVLKTLYEPWDQLPAKLKVAQKRCTQVQIQRLAISILPTREIDTLRYILIDLQFPSIVYRTFKDEQQVIVNIVFKLWHQKQKMKELMVGDCKSLRIRYLNYKDKKQKSIQIVHGKGIVLNFTDINNQTLYSMIQQAKELKQLKRNYLHADPQGNSYKYAVALKNETAKRVKLLVNNTIVLTALPFQEEEIAIEIQTYLLMMSNPNSFVEIHEEGLHFVRKTATELHISEPNLINPSHCLLIASTPKSSKFIYRPICTLKNYTSCTIYLKDRRILRTGETLSYLPYRSNIQFEMKQSGWSKECSISVKKDEEVFGDDSFIACFKKQDDLMVVELFDRFILKNMTPISIFINEKELMPSQELSLGYVAKSQRNSFPIKFDDVVATLNLIDSTNRIKLFTKVLQITSIEKKIAIELRTEFQTVRNISIINLYSEFTIKNLTNQRIFFILGKSQCSIRPNQTLMLPIQYSKVQIKEGQAFIDIVFNKNKQFFSKNYKFTYQNRLEKKITIIKIESKHSVRNNSSEIVDVEIDKNKVESIMPSQTYPLTSDIIRQHTIALIFGKLYKKMINIEKAGTNFLEVEQQFYKVTLLSKDESIIIIEDSKNSHKIVNKLENISIIAHTYDEPKQNKEYSFFEINNDTNIEKLIKADQTLEIGLFSWNNPLIELEFYLDNKNIEFKQKFTLNFEKLEYKFSYKHVLHDDKDKKNIFFLVITVEKDSEGRYTITVYKEREYESLPIEKMKVFVQELSLSFIISSQLADNVTFECFKASFVREKGIELTEFDIQVEKLLIRQGKNVSILSALGKSRFLNSHLILSKTARGIGINNFIIKLTPLQITCKEKIIFKVLEKIVEVRAQNPKKSGKERIELMYQESLKSKSSRFAEETSLIRQTPDITTTESKLEKHWEDLKKQKKDSKFLIINNLELSQTSVFITYSKEEYKQFDEKIASDQIIKYMLLMPSISQLKISVPHLKISEFTGEPKEFAKEVVSRLKQSIGSTIANSFSALPFFDNPVIVVDGILQYIDGMLSIQ